MPGGSGNDDPPERGPLPECSYLIYERGLACDRPEPPAFALWTWIVLICALLPLLLLRQRR